MAEDLTYCVRGCVRPCGCAECAAADRPVHAPLKRQATHGYLCRRCRDRLVEMLGDIEDLYATLDPRTPLVRDEAGVKQGKLSGSPALVRLDVVALQDPRTFPGPVVTRDGHVESDDGLVNVVAAVGGWAQVLAEEHAIRGSLATLTESCGLLTRWIDEVCASVWVDECFDELTDVVRALRRAHGDTRPRPLGQCINVYERDGQTVACRGVLYAPAEGVAVRCRACGRRYDGNAMLLAKMQAKRDQEGA